MNIFQQKKLADRAELSKKEGETDCREQNIKKYSWLGGNATNGFIIK